MKLYQNLILRASLLSLGLFGCRGIINRDEGKDIVYSTAGLEQITQSQNNSESTAKNRKKLALLIIDMQDHFFQYVDSAEMNREIPNYVALIKEAQKNKVPIFLVEFEGYGETNKSIKYALSLDKYDTISKHDASSFIGTDLDEKLNGLGIEEVILAGLRADACVYATGRSAITRKYAVDISMDITAFCNLASGTYSNNVAMTWYEQNTKLFPSHKEIIQHIKVNADTENKLN
ncbi:MAG: isochorismatase family cysteine hydrolase [Candidatus Nanoarchaeia archaeon]